MMDLHWYRKPHRVTSSTNFCPLPASCVFSGSIRVDFIDHHVALTLMCATNYLDTNRSETSQEFGTNRRSKKSRPTDGTRSQHVSSCFWSRSPVQVLRLGE